MAKRSKQIQAIEVPVIVTEEFPDGRATVYGEVVRLPVGGREIECLLQRRGGPRGRAVRLTHVASGYTIGELTPFKAPRNGVKPSDTDAALALIESLAARHGAARVLSVIDSSPSFNR